MAPKEKSHVGDRATGCPDLSVVAARPGRRAPAHDADRGADRARCEAQRARTLRRAPRVAHAAARGDQAARRRGPRRPAAQPRRGRGAARRGRRDPHVRAARRRSKACRASSPPCASPTTSVPRSARCTTRCWPATRVATCRAITGSTRAIHRAINEAARNPVLAQHLSRRSTPACRRCAFAPTRTTPSGSAAVKEHETMIDALDARDARGAARRAGRAPASQARQRADAAARRRDLPAGASGA